MGTITGGPRLLGAAAVGMLLAAGAAVVATHVVLGASGSDLGVMAFTLFATGMSGIFAAALAPRWFAQIGLRGQFVLLATLCLALLIVNIVVAAGLMFISGHDLRLLFVLGAYAAAATAIPVHIMSRGASSRIEAVEAAAARIAGGELNTRVLVRGSDEIGRLAAEFNRMADALESANDRRDQVEGARRELFASVSHDLRTPLSSIQVMVEALSDGVVRDAATRDRYLKTMSLELDRLASLIDDLFELAKIESGELQLRLETLSIEDVVSDALETFRPQVERAAVHLAFEHGDSPLAIQADPARLNRVIYNLLQNALRHTPGDGSITLRTSSVAGQVQVAVCDTGEGIAAQDIPFVFDRFYRGDKSRARALASSGLGLSIARAIVEAHGGRIWVDPDAQIGATVVFSLPTASAVLTGSRGA